MLDEKTLYKRALNECIDMMGKDLVMQHKDLCCSGWGFSDGIYELSLGMDVEDKELEFLWGTETPMDYYAFVEVDANTGKVTRDYKNSILPI